MIPHRYTPFAGPGCKTSRTSIKRDLFVRLGFSSAFALEQLRSFLNWLKVDSNLYLLPIISPRGGARQEEEREEQEQQEIEIQHTETQDVTKLPPPNPLPCDDYGNQISLRIPTPLARENEPFLINYEDELAPSPAVLFQTHLDRWNQIRQRWREASLNNEQRYEDSFSILRQIHDRYLIISECAQFPYAAMLAYNVY